MRSCPVIAFFSYLNLLFYASVDVSILSSVILAKKHTAEHTFFTNSKIVEAGT
jgi:hypothetical protein